MTPPAANRNVLRQATTLAAFAAAATLLVSGIQQLSGDRAALNHAADELRLLQDVLPDDFDNQPLQDMKMYRNPELLGTSKAMPVYFARRGEEFLGMAVTVMAPDGYVAPIRLLVGIDPGGQVIGVRITEHRETPGLGDRIEHTRTDWLQQLRGKSLQGARSEAWRVRREGGEFDQLSGATVTSSAVLRAVESALQFSATVTAEAARKAPSSDEQARQERAR